MPPLGSLTAFFLVALALIVIPGPSVLFVIARSIANGRAGGIASLLGNALGGLVLVVAVACGLGAVLATSEVLFTAVKVLGSAYLVFLGVQAIRHRKHRSTTTVATQTKMTSLLRQGFTVGVTNPKTAVFFAAVLPQFVDYRVGSVPLQLAVLGVFFLLIALATDTVWALLAGTARGWFARSPRRIERLDTAGGLTMIGLGGYLATSSRLS